MEQTNTLAELAEIKIDIVAWCNACRANWTYAAANVANIYGEHYVSHRYLYKYANHAAWL